MRVSLMSALLILLLAVSATAQEQPVTFLDEGDVVTALAGENEGPLELVHCLDLAMSANEDLQQQREVLGELGGQRIVAISNGLPRIEFQGAFSRGRDPSFAFDASFAGSGEDPYQPVYDYVDPLFQAAGITPPDVSGGGGGGFFPPPEDIPAQTFWRTYLDGVWELRPTALWRAVNAADDAILQQEARISDTANRTGEAVIQSFHGVILAQERVVALERELEARAEFLEVTRRRYMLDFATPLDTLQAAVSLANLRPEHRRRQVDLRKAAQELNQLIGRDPMTPVAVIATFPLEDEVIDQQVALTLAARRPDLMAQRAQSQIWELQRGVASAMRHPYLSAEAQWGFVTNDLADLTNLGHDFWRVGVTLHIPIFTALNPKGQIKQAEAEIRRNESIVRQLGRKVRDEVVLGLADLEVARINLSAAELNMRQAEDAYTQISLRYELGKSDRLEVLNSQTARFVARTTLIEARYDVLATTATLKRAMGISPARALSTVSEVVNANTPGEQ